MRITEMPLELIPGRQDDDVFFENDEAGWFVIEGEAPNSLGEMSIRVHMLRLQALQNKDAEDQT